MERISWTDRAPGAPGDRGSVVSILDDSGQGVSGFPSGSRRRFEQQVHLARVIGRSTSSCRLQPAEDARPSAGRAWESRPDPEARSYLLCRIMGLGERWLRTLPSREGEESSMAMLNIPLEQPARSATQHSTAASRDLLPHELPSFE